MKPFSSRPALASPALAALGLGLLSTLATVLALLALRSAQQVAQRPAAEGVLVFRLGPDGALRLWNQPIAFDDAPQRLERAQGLTARDTPLVVRLVPDPTVPWGVVHGLLRKLGPNSPADHWILQLQLP